MVVKIKNNGHDESTTEVVNPFDKLRRIAGESSGNIISKTPDTQVIKTEASPQLNHEQFEWKVKDLQKKSTTVRCIVIDRKNRWHKGTPVDLKGANMASCTWGYYGQYYPVLVEKEDGRLVPWHLPDIVGESSNRLYKAANPDNYKNAVELENSNLLQKIQIGLMVAVVLGLFFLMYVLLNQ